MRAFSFHYGVALAAVLLTVFSQFLLKRGARSDRRHRFAIWLNALTLSGYAILLVVTLMNLYAYTVIPIRANVFLLPLVFLLVTVMSVVALHERLTRMQVVGCLLIAAGVAVFNL